MIRPLSDKILLKVESFKEEKETASGIVYATENTNATETAKGVVVAFGPDVKSVLSIDDTVYFESHARHSVAIEGKEYVLIQEVNLLGVLDV